jgi:hypothetical protein
MTGEPITRRNALKFAALIALASQGGWRTLSAYASALSARGYGTDPDLLKRVVPWPRTLSSEQLAALAALCEIVLPAEPAHPSAKTVGVHDFLDEWVSAPYPQMQADREIILRGLADLDRAALEEFKTSFDKVTPVQQLTLFDRCCGSEASADFAKSLIGLICSGYYTTHEGHAAIGYVGNIALARFPGPPPKVVRHLEQALAALQDAQGKP